MYSSSNEGAIEEFMRNELLFVRKYIRDLPHSLLIAFAKEFDGLTETAVKEKQKELYEMYRLSTDSSILNLEISLRGTAQLIVKPESYSISQNGKVAIFTKGETMLVGSIEQFGSTRQEIENNLRDWMYIEVTKGNPNMNIPNAKIAHVEPLQGFNNVEEAKRLLNEYDLLPIEVFLLGLGVRPCKDTLRLFYPRILPLFYYDGTPIHVIQLTNTDSGKSHYSVRLEFMLGWTHFTEFPSAAKLIYDGRQGTKGAVFTSNGIAIDEIDKLRKDRFEDCYQPLNTGLENGIWRRGIQTRQGIALEGYRFIPFLMFGNIAKGEQPLLAEFTGNPRVQIETMFDAMTGYDCHSLIERIAICDIVPKKIPISRYLMRNEDGVVGVLRDSVMRGLINYLEMNIPTQYVKESANCFGRLRRHAEAVFNVTKVLFERKPDEDLVRMMIVGDIDIGLVLFNESEVKETPKEEHIKEIEIDFTKYEETGSEEIYEHIHEEV